MVGTGGKKPKLTPEESRERYKEKKMGRAASQQQMGFADAWAERNKGKVDIWLIIAALFFLIPFGTLGYGIWSGIIPIN
eukprot:CAMPEP_0185834716 /NCGR_PEP_ID=MMETSP1353-20130828/6048_1 /TAXON_ID=1077150 /ORGANISM="Erythrolobus australicus, Strain CCMP3124" /LENGTH=78 /DNA_ID=CAMNT_0028533203 /DNA_START=233 /DNA_END=469 /DNA_ORIENTATION=+